MNHQPEPTKAERPSCARCEAPGTSLLVEVGEQGRGTWLCARHLARLQGHAATVPELDGIFDGALVITEITTISNDEQGRAG